MKLVKIISLLAIALVSSIGKTLAPSIQTHESHTVVSTSNEQPAFPKEHRTPIESNVAKPEMHGKLEASEKSTIKNVSHEEKQERLVPAPASYYKDLWQREANNLPWFKKWNEVLIWNEPYAHWFAGGELNASYACLDRHVHSGKGNKIAYLWRNEEGKKRSITYQQLYDEVNRMASVLKSWGFPKAIE